MREEAARALAQLILEPGETLLWSQAAPPWPIASPAMFGVIVCGVILWLLPKMKLTQTGFERLLANTAVAIFATMLFCGLVFGIFQALSAWSTASAITDRRVVIVSSHPWQWLRAYGPSHSRAMASNTRRTLSRASQRPVRPGSRRRTHPDGTGAASATDRPVLAACALRRRRQQAYAMRSPGGPHSRLRVGASP